MTFDTTLQIIAWVFSVAIILAIGIFAIVISFSPRFRKLSSTTEGFITARKSQKTLRIAYSLFSSAIGSWAIATPAIYAQIGGVVGLVVYAFVTGLPLLAIGELGKAVHAKMPHVLSLHDYTLHRFGRIVQGYVALLTLFNVGVALTAEYTTIGSIFAEIVGTVSWPYLMTVGVITMTYTYFGGLAVSIVTDFIQGSIVLLLVLLLVVYVAITFREPLPQPLPEEYGPTNAQGWDSIISLGISLLAATVFSEAMWQRAWAAENSRTLRLGSIMGASLTTLVIFTLGFISFLAIWAGLPFPGENTMIFASLTDGVYGWPGLILIFLAVVMNETAIDSLQNALVATLTSWFFAERPVTFARIVLLVINIPLIVIATLQVNVLSLFLVTNVMSSTAMFPIISGVFIDAKGRYIRAFSVLLACLTSLICTIILGMSRSDWDFGGGLRYTFLDNNFNRDIFLVALFTSIGGLIIWSALEYFFLRKWVEFLDFGADLSMLRRVNEQDWSRRSREENQDPGSEAILTQHQMKE